MALPAGIGVNYVLSHVFRKAEWRLSHYPASPVGVTSGTDHRKARGYPVLSNHCHGLSRGERRHACLEPYNAAMDDTHPEVRRTQIERWRRMTPAEKLMQAGDLRETVLQLARVGVRARHPEAGERECFLRLMLLTLGPELARAACPEIAPG